MAAADELIQKLNLEVLEILDLPGRPEQNLPLPVGITEGPLADALRGIRPDLKAWKHQSLALERLQQGENVVVATGTASGKSLIFQLHAFHRIKEDPRAKVLIFYPLKALGSDQFVRWQGMAQSLGFDPSVVARIDGDVKVEREKLLDAGRVILMTPDVCHAWLMRSVGSSHVRRFLESLVLLVLDEAHVYESVFGSNVAFLLRRMISAKRRATRSEAKRLQFIAATATIAEPAQHLERLTGLSFTVVDEPDNGAPAYQRQIIHVNGAEYGAGGEAALTDLAKGALGLSDNHRFIAFMDSRQGIERIVRQIGDSNVLPYRSGYESSDRQAIEHALRSGRLHGVVATSALELGIDVADMSIGMNLGVPDSRKAFRQRIGRVGRGAPGVFFVIAPPSAFHRFGETFKEYYEGSVEPSYLYLGNRFIQFAQARCVLDEVEVLGGDQAVPPSGVSWPDGFETSLRYARPGGGRPREFDFIAQLGADSPHFNYPLRQVGEASFDIKDGRGEHSSKVGNIATQQAIREAYPGATYLHLGRAYWVHEWRTSSFDRSIRVSAGTETAITRPILRKCVTLGLTADGIVDGRIKRGKTGLIAEVHLQVNESVEGYRLGSTPRLYKDLRAENPNMSRKQRDFRTTGIVVKIEEAWFAGTKDDIPKIRESVAEGLLGLLCRERSISPRDVDATHTNIALITEAGPRRLTDAIVIYDSVYGGLRLTEDLYKEFDKFIGQLGRAAELAGADALVTDDLAGRLAQWCGSLSDGTGDVAGTVNAPDGWLQVYKTGSVVSVLFNGNFIERELIEPKLLDPFATGSKSLWYTYKNGGPATSFISHDQIQATGQDWSWVLWNPETGQFQDLDDGTEPSDDA